MPQSPLAVPTVGPACCTCQILATISMGAAFAVVTVLTVAVAASRYDCAVHAVIPFVPLVDLVRLSSEVLPSWP